MATAVNDNIVTITIECPRPRIEDVARILLEKPGPFTQDELDCARELEREMTSEFPELWAANLRRYGFSDK